MTTVTTRNILWIQWLWSQWVRNVCCAEAVPVVVASGSAWIRPSSTWTPFTPTRTLRNSANTGCAHFHGTAKAPQTRGKWLVAENTYQDDGFCTSDASARSGFGRRIVVERPVTAQANVSPLASSASSLIPATFTMPTSPRRLHMLFPSTCLAPTSATLCSPSTFFNTTRPCWAWRCTQREGVYKCLTRPTPRRIAIPAQATASYRGLQICPTGPSHRLCSHRH